MLQRPNQTFHVLIYVYIFKVLNFVLLSCGLQHKIPMKYIELFVNNVNKCGKSSMGVNTLVVSVKCMSKQQHIQPSCFMFILLSLCAFV